MPIPDLPVQVCDATGDAICTAVRLIKIIRTLFANMHAMKKNFLFAFVVFFLSIFSFAQTLNYTLITNGLNTVTFESGVSEIETGDVNGDGKIDIVTIGDHGSPHVNATEAGIMVWKNNGAGTAWSLVRQGNLGYGGVALGDINNDGLMDIGYSMHHNYGTDDFGNQLIEVALGNGSGASWQPYDDGLATNGETYGMFGIDFADINNDGLLDLVSNSFGCCNGFHVYKNNGDGTWLQTFASNGGNGNQWCKFGDFDNDGNDDIIAATDNVQLWRNDGNGNFAPMQNGLSLGWNIELDIADVNNDGAKDIAVIKNGAHVYTFDTATQTWKDISSGLPASGIKSVRLADMNMDGQCDLIAWSSKNISIYGYVNRSWSQLASFATDETTLSGMAVADFDHDGFNDIAYLASTNTGDNKLRVYLHVEENTSLKIIPVFPKGGEHFIAGSVQMLQWLSSVPAGDTSVVTIQFSSNGAAGPWKTIVNNAPNENLYQASIPAINSNNCFLRYKIKTLSANKQVIMRLPFSISPNIDAIADKKMLKKVFYDVMKVEEE